MQASLDSLKDRLPDPLFIAPALPPYVQITQLLGKGGQGVVFAGSVGGQPAAVKIYFPGQNSKRIERETHLLASLQCPSIVQLLWSGEVALDGELLPAMATALIQGRTLDEQARRRPLSDEQLGPVAFDIAQAIGAMWSRRVVHRDLKPSNILVTPAGRAVVIDLGLARHLDQSSLTALGGTWGTRGYLSPEQARAVRQLTCKSDVFALGIIIVEAATGAHPSGRDQDRLLAMSLSQNLPPRLVQWRHHPLLCRMLSPQPTMRPLPGEILSELRTFGP